MPPCSSSSTDALSVKGSGTMSLSTFIPDVVGLSVFCGLANRDDEVLGA